jgi:hypothetical protein
MSRSKHPKTKASGGLGQDNDRNPGIGSSKGTTMGGFDPEDLEGNSTFEGDVMSETTRAGGVDPNRKGRTNK